METAPAQEPPEGLNVAAPGPQATRRRSWRFRIAAQLTREHTIAEASLILIVAFFLSAVLGAVRQVLLNARFGAGWEASAYYAASRLPDTLFQLVAGGALSGAMLPVLVSIAREQGERAAGRLTNLILTTLLAAVALVVLAGLVFTPFFVTKVLAPGFDAETSKLTITLTRIMLIQPLVLAVGTVATAVLNSRNQFLLTGLSVVSHNVTIIAGVAAAMAVPGLGIYGPTLGVVAGAVLQVLILLPGLLHGHFRYRPAWNLRDRGLREVIRLLIPNSLSVAVSSAAPIIDTSFASRAPEAAGLPALHNAWLLAALPITLFGHAVGQSAFPRLAAYAAAGEWSRMRRTVLWTLLVVIALAIPALLGLIMIGRPAIRILFEHGKFDAAAGSLTYAVLVPYVLGLPAYVSTEVLTRALIAMRDTRTPLLTNTAQLVGRVAILTLLLGSAGILAIPTAFAVTSAVEAVVLGMVLLFKIRRRIQAQTR